MYEPWTLRHQPLTHNLHGQLAHMPGFAVCMPCAHARPPSACNVHPQLPTNLGSRAWLPLIHPELQRVASACLRPRVNLHGQPAHISGPTVYMPCAHAGHPHACSAHAGPPSARSAHARPPSARSALARSPSQWAHHPAPLFPRLDAQGPNPDSPSPVPTSWAPAPPAPPLDSRPTGTLTPPHQALGVVAGNAYVGMSGRVGYVG